MAAEEKADFFQRPAYKLMISDLRSAVQRESPPNQGDVIMGEGEEQDVEEEWVLTLTKLASPKGGKQDVPLKEALELHLKLIWIQGTVVRVEKTETGNLSLFISDDEDGRDEAMIYEYNTVPGGDHPEIQIGSYVGTLGQVWSNNPVVVKATKIMYLSDKPLCKSLWKDEVALGKAFLAGMILPGT